MPVRWTLTQKKRARKLLRAIALYRGGWTKLAADLNLGSRATPYSWMRRGSVPFVYVEPLLKLRPRHLGAKATDLCPQAQGVAR